MILFIFSISKSQESTSLGTKDSPSTIINNDKSFFYEKQKDVTLTPELKDCLDEVIKLLKNDNILTVRIVGHSDNSGSFNENMEISLLRAKNVVDHLLTAGISHGRILDRGAGALEPIASNDKEEGRAKNRRVQIRVIKILKK